MANTEYGAVKLTTLTGIANAIRLKDGSSGTIKPVDMAAKITNIPTGGITSRLNGTLTEVDDTDLTTLCEYGLAYCPVTSVNIPNVTEIQIYGFFHCESLTSLVLPNVTTLGTNAFSNCYVLNTVELTKRVSITNGCFTSCRSLENLILRDSAGVYNLTPSALNSSTPFAANGSGGTVYVPSSLKSSYESNNTWAAIIALNANNKIEAIEGSIYE